MNAATNQPNPLSNEAFRQFGALEPVIINEGMIRNAISKLQTLEGRLAANMLAYVNDNGGEEAFKEAVDAGGHANFQLAVFKIELVKATIKRFEEQLDSGTKVVDDFVLINPES
jgi:hypothetical protein